MWPVYKTGWLHIEEKDLKTINHILKGITMKFRIHLVAVFCALILSLAVLSMSPVNQTAHAAAHATEKTAQPAAATISVQKIVVVNDAGFVLNFSVASLNSIGVASYSAPTDNYPIDQSRTIDASTLGIATGTTIFPHVSAIAGNTVDGVRVQYAPNGQVATYEVQGTTLNYTVTLLS